MLFFSRWKAGISAIADIVIVQTTANCGVVVKSTILDFDDYHLCWLSLGHKLLYNQSDVPIDGWSVECRVYAEVNYFTLSHCLSLLCYLVVWNNRSDGIVDVNKSRYRERRLSYGLILWHHSNWRPHTLTSLAHILSSKGRLFTVLYCAAQLNSCCLLLYGARGVTNAMSAILAS